MENLALAAAALACPISMGLMMWFMARPRRSDKPEAQVDHGVEELRAEHRRLGAEIERLDDRSPAGTRH